MPDKKEEKKHLKETSINHFKYTVFYPILFYLAIHTPKQKYNEIISFRIMAQTTYQMNNIKVTINNVTVYL